MFRAVAQAWAVKNSVLTCVFADHFSSVALCVAANCGPAGMKPAETFLVTYLETTQDAGTKLAHTPNVAIPVF